MIKFLFLTGVLAALVMLYIETSSSCDLSTEESAKGCSWSILERKRAISTVKNHAVFSPKHLLLESSYDPSLTIGPETQRSSDDTQIVHYGLQSLNVQRPFLGVDAKLIESTHLNCGPIKKRALSRFIISGFFFSDKTTKPTYRYQDQFFAGVGIGHENHGDKKPFAFSVVFRPIDHPYVYDDFVKDNKDPVELHHFQRYDQIDPFSYNNYQVKWDASAKKIHFSAGHKKHSFDVGLKEIYPAAIDQRQIGLALFVPDCPNPTGIQKIAVEVKNLRDNLSGVDRFISLF